MHSHIILLEDSSLLEGTEDLIETSESTLSPDDEATKVATGRKLEEAEAADIDELNTGEVAKRLDDAVVLVVDDKGTAALAVTPVPHLALTRAELARVRDLDDIGVSVQGLEQSDSLLGLLVGLDSRVDNKGNLVDLLDAVTTSKDVGNEDVRKGLVVH